MSQAIQYSCPPIANVECILCHIASVGTIILEKKEGGEFQMPKNQWKYQDMPNTESIGLILEDHSFCEFLCR